MGEWRKLDGNLQAAGYTRESARWKRPAIGGTSLSPGEGRGASPTGHALRLGSGTCHPTAVVPYRGTRFACPQSPPGRRMLASRRRTGGPRRCHSPTGSSGFPGSLRCPGGGRASGPRGRGRLLADGVQLAPAGAGGQDEEVEHRGQLAEVEHDDVGSPVVLRRLRGQQCPLQAGGRLVRRGGLSANGAIFHGQLTSRQGLSCSRGHCTWPQGPWPAGPGVTHKSGGAKIARGVYAPFRRRRC